MKKVFTIFCLIRKDVHVPSSSYYARGNDSETDTIPLLHYVEEFTSEEAAETFLENNGDPVNGITLKEGTYIVVPTYIK
jgi:hypothetical protein